MIDKGICDKIFNWTPIIYECECDKSCDVEEYLDYKKYKCRKKLAHKLVEKCNENNEKKLHPRELHLNKMMYNLTLNDYENICSPCTVYIVFFVEFFIIGVSISGAFAFFYWHLKRKYIEKTIYWMQLSWTYKWEQLSVLIL